jgi:hypothetical protein
MRCNPAVVGGRCTIHISVSKERLVDFRRQIAVPHGFAGRSL